MFLEHVELNLLLIAIIALVIVLVSGFFLTRSVIGFKKEPIHGSAVPEGMPNLFYKEPVHDTPTYKRKGVKLSFDNYELSASS